MVDLTDDMLRELVMLAGKATPGPWDTDEPNIVYSMTGGGCVYLANTEGLDTSVQQCRDDASFIAAANPATVAALASELLKLREAVKPFAALGQYILDEDLQTKPDGQAIWAFDRNDLTYGDFRRAAKAIGASNV